MNTEPKKGSVADWKRTQRFLNRETTLGQAICEGIFLVAVFALMIAACAVFD